MSPFQRLFAGLELREVCKQTLVALDPQLPGLRWLPPAQLHLTLSFIGAWGA
jgi:2'-5' RNA ligase